MLAFAALPALAADDPWALEAVGPVVAISDIHGAHSAFVETLARAGLIDADTHWIGGSRQLVIVGDILDRGDDSRASMDLLMRLETEAARDGGAVHVVLGNHEIMNLVGDLRYVARGEYLAFAQEETAQQRDTAFARAQARRGANAAPLDRATFDDRYPPGFFAHRDAFASDGRYGRWLLEKPLALRIDETLFVHAGLSESVAELGLAGVNGSLREELVDYLAVYEDLRRRGILDVTDDFYGIADELAGNSFDTATAAQVERLLTLHDSMLHGPGSPLWYRGNVDCSPLIERDRLLRTLRAFDSGRVVVGHTPTFGRRIWRRLDGRVLLIDAGMQAAFYAGQGAALLIDGDQLRAVYQHGSEEPVDVDRLPPRAGLLSRPFADPADLEKALAEGAVSAREGTRLTLSFRGQEIDAEFLPQRRGGFDADVAAYQLDRLLELGMVPAAVSRSIDGQPGTVRHLPPRLLSETQRQEEGVRLPARCPLQDQYRAVQVFDALLHNEKRSGETLLYGVASGQVVLTGHDSGFGTRSRLPRQLPDGGLVLGEAWRDALRRLIDGAATGPLEAALGSRRYRALLKRAAALLDS